MNTFLWKLALVVSLSTGGICSAASMLEDRLVLPEIATSTVEFELPHDSENINAADLLQVFVGNSAGCCDSKSAIAGRYRVKDRTVVFDPAFDFVEGQDYTVKIRNNNIENETGYVVREFRVERDSTSVSPEVIAIYPSSGMIPENTLRFYIHFSTPMQPNVSTQYIKLLDESGTSDTQAFMKFKQELWSEDRRRLTLLLDPGRIKRGVAQNLTLGPALIEGKVFSIVIEDGWPAANDKGKMPRFEKEYAVSQPLRTIPNPDMWTIDSPRSLTSDPLVIKFDREFDREYLQRAIVVMEGDGQLVEGVVSIENSETTWRFDRKGVWNNSQIKIVVDACLEDVAGNNFRELLDHPSETVVPDTHRKIIALTLDKGPSQHTDTNAERLTHTQ